MLGAPNYQEVEDVGLESPTYSTSFLLRLLDAELLVGGFGFLDADQAVVIEVELIEILRPAQEFGTRHVAVVVAVHFAEPEGAFGRRPHVRVVIRLGHGTINHAGAHETDHHVRLQGRPRNKLAVAGSRTRNRPQALRISRTLSRPSPSASINPNKLGVCVK